MVWTLGAASATASFGDSSTTSRTSVARPTGIASGDWLFLSFYIELTGITPSFSNGSWTQIRADVQTGPTPDFTAFLYASRYAGEGSTFDLTWGGSNAWNTGNMAIYSGGASGSQGDTAATTGTGNISGSSSTTVNYTGFVPAIDNDLIVYAQTDFDSRTNGALSGTTPTLTERVDFGNCSLGEGVQTTAADITNRTSTLSAASWSVGQIVAWTLNAVGGGPTVTYPQLERAVLRGANRGVLLGVR